MAECIVYIHLAILARGGGGCCLNNILSYKFSSIFSMRLIYLYEFYRKKVIIMGNIFSIRLTDEDKVHLQQRMNETGKNATEVFKSAIYFTEIDADLVDEIISNIDIMRVKKIWKG